MPLKPGDLFVESELSAGVDAIRELYRQRGFAAATSSPPSTRPIAAVGRRGAESGRRSSIVEGPRSAVGDVTITGNSAIPSDELQAARQDRRRRALLSSRAIVEARDALVLEYLNRGFASADVDAGADGRAPIAPGSISTSTIQEGPQTIVDHILIVGNAHTNPEVILRELQFQPGRSRSGCRISSRAGGG